MKKIVFFQPNLLMLNRNRNTLADLSPKQAIRKAFSTFEKGIGEIIKEANGSYNRATGKEVKAHQEIISWLSRVETQAAILRGSVEVAAARL